MADAFGWPFYIDENFTLELACRTEQAYRGFYVVDGDSFCMIARGILFSLQIYCLQLPANPP